MSADGDHQASSASFAHELRRHRLAAELTQRDLAERSGISLRAISDLERGINHAPQRETARMLGDALPLNAEDRARFLDLARRRPQVSALRSFSRPAGEQDPLIGRMQELELIRNTIFHPGTRLVTLAGPGGVGKTRLAMELAQILGTRHPGGVPFIRFDGLQDPALVIPTLAAAVNVSTTGSPPALPARIATHISTQDQIVVLDNLEHLLASAPDLGHVASLMHGGCLLVTSREALRLSIEQVIPIRPLPRPNPHQPPSHTLIPDTSNPAIQLFLRRARSQCGDLPLDENSDAGRINLESVAYLCHRLDGLPLAIELAAAQVPVYSPQAINDMLSQAGLPLLSGGLRDKPARLQTMEASIAWSYGGLEESEQRAFRALSVFAGGFGLAAAAAVLTPGVASAVPPINPLYPHACTDVSVLALVRSLCRKHLIMPDEDAPAHVGPRFRMLEPLRLFALEQLRLSGEEPLARLRHAHYFTALASVLDPKTIGAETEMRLEQQQTDLDNFRVAIDWALAAGEGDLAVRTTGNIAQFWKLRGYLTEARQRMSAALQVDTQSSTTDRWFLRFWAITFALEVGDHQDALALAEELLAIGQAAGDLFAEGVGYAMLSRARGASPGQNNENVSLARRAVEILEPLGRDEWSGLAWVRLGVELHRAGKLPAARDALSRGLELRRAEPFAGLVASALMSLGAVRFDLGEAQSALADYQEALTLALIEENHTAIVAAILGLADITWSCGEGLPEQRMQNAVRLVAAAEAYRIRYDLGHDAVIRAIAVWMAPMHERWGENAVSAEFSAGTYLEPSDIAVSVAQQRITVTEPGQRCKPAGPTLLSGFGSLQ